MFLRHLFPGRFSRTQLLLWPSFKLSSPSLISSPLLRQLVFCSHTHSGYAHITHRVYPLQTSALTSAELIKISSTVKDMEGEGEGQGSEAAKEDKEVISEPESIAVAPISERECWTDIPRFLVTYIPKVSTLNLVDTYVMCKGVFSKVHSPWEPPYCSNRSAEYHRLLWVCHGGPAALKEVLLHGPPSDDFTSTTSTTTTTTGEDSAARNQITDLLRAPSPAGLMALSPPWGWSNIQIPGILLAVQY